MNYPVILNRSISDNQQSCGYEDGPSKGPGPRSAGGRGFISIHMPPATIGFAPMKHALAVAVEPFKFSSRYGGVAMN